MDCFIRSTSCNDGKVKKNKNSNADISEIEGEIDKIVYWLYNLDSEEIKIIEEY